jgi:hypothetical protein
MAAKFKKGDEVWVFGDWDHKGGAYVRRMVLTSYGAKQGTAVYPESGKQVKHRIYAADYERMRLVSEMPDPVPHAADLSREFRAYWIQHFVDRAHWYYVGKHGSDYRVLDRGNEAYFTGLKASCEEVMSLPPRVMILAENYGDRKEIRFE